MNTAYEQQEVDSAVQSLDPFYHHHEKRLLDTALNLLIDRFIDLFTDTVQLLDFGFFFFFQIAITLKRENKMLDSCHSYSTQHLPTILRDVIPNFYI